MKSYTDERGHIPLNIFLLFTARPLTPHALGFSLTKNEPVSSCFWVSGFSTGEFDSNKNSLVGFAALEASVNARNIPHGTTAVDELR